ncbi:MAG: hypothetical protein AAGC93_26360 [Cyanobacteria bacterium P01_F01_bin.53]
MTYYHPNRRKVYGTEQLTTEHELLTTTEYAARYAYTRDAIVKKCRKKQLIAFKQAGVWYIVTAKAT